jgi:hypothetical protein
VGAQLSVFPLQADVDSVLEANRKHRAALLERKRQEKLQGLGVILSTGTGDARVDGRKEATALKKKN